MYEKQLSWILSQRQAMVEMLVEWVNTNSGTDNIEGLKQMLGKIQEAFSVLEAKTEVIPLKPSTKVNSYGVMEEKPLGDILRFTKRPHAPIQIFLCGHMDTVYPVDSPFQLAKLVDDHTLVGPGATDMKGGLIIMLKALEALEQFEESESIGWQVIINSDEEIGSVGSEQIIRETCSRHSLGLIFEPSFPDGYIVNSRKGSVNFSIVSRGKHAHAGRDFDKGVNAITNLMKILLKINALNGLREGMTINIGHISGGGPVNIVPDLAICHCNSRMLKSEDLDFLMSEIGRLVDEENLKPGIDLCFYKESYRLPKPFDTKQKMLFEDLRSCSEELSMELNWRPSGGVCDGNILAQEGLPTVDTLGAVGSGIHTFDETTKLDSLVDKAQLCAFFLMKIASHAIDVNRYTSNRYTAKEPK